MRVDIKLWKRIRNNIEELRNYLDEFDESDEILNESYNLLKEFEKIILDDYFKTEES